VRADLPVSKVIPDGEDASVSKAKLSTSRRLRFVVSEDEDDGLEKLPSETERTAADAPESSLSSRLWRNMLPCCIDEDLGTMWCRTADMRSMVVSLARRRDESTARDLKEMMIYFRSAVRRGFIADTRHTLADSHCGSCGQARGVRHEVTADEAVLYTHHPTAPSIRVSFYDLLSFICLFSTIGACSLRRFCSVVVHVLHIFLLILLLFSVLSFCADLGWTLGLRCAPLQAGG